MNNQKKHFYLFHTAALLVIISLFTVLTFESLHADHELHCHDDGCPVCLVLQIIHNTKNILDAKPVASVEFSYFYFINLIILSALVLSPITLVSQKIKLVI